MSFIPDKEFETSFNPSTNQSVKMAGFIPDEESLQLPQKRISFLHQPKEYIGETISNIPSSGKRFLGDIKTAITHPIETITGLGKIGAGAIQSIPGISELYTERAKETGKTSLLEENKQAFQNVKNFFIERYGNPERISETIKNDPVGFAIDLSTIASGGASLTAKSPRLVGISSAFSKAGMATEPITATARTIKATTKIPLNLTGRLATESLGVSTGVGGEVIREALKNPSPEFTAALRGITTKDNILTGARDALQSLKENRAKTYQTQLSGIEKIKNKIDFSPAKQNIENKLKNYNIKRIKNGTLDFSKSTIADIAEQKRISSVVEETLRWKDYTPKGLDILKRRLDDFFTTSGQGRALTNSIRKNVDDLLIKNVEGYQDMVKGYQQATSLIKEIENTLSLKPGARIDTTIRKLTSAMKQDNEFRKILVMTLDDLTKKDLTGSLAGAALNPVVPSGLIGRSIFATGLAGLGSLAGILTLNPSLFAGLIVSSPRIVGEFLRALGLSNQYISNFVKVLQRTGITEKTRLFEKGLFQAGRLERISK